MKVKVIMMDVDGTLTNDQKKVTPKTKEALIKAEELGAILILASGRPTSGLWDLCRELQMDQYHGLFVSYNGSQVVDCMTKEILFNQALAPEDAREILRHMKHFDRVRPMIDHGEYMYVENVYDNYIQYQGKPFNVMEYESRGGKFKLCEVDDLSEFVDFPLNKILTTSDPEYLQKHHKEMAEPFKDRFSCMFTGAFYYEFTAKGIDKAKALDTVLGSMGYHRKEMIAFGDGQNDASMLNYAGYAVAMENAVDELKDIADEVTLSNNEDGIAVSLYKNMDGLCFDK